MSFGDGFLEHSLLELFERNLLEHRILLPAQLEQAPATMPHVRMHNGTIWNWNRALIGFEQDGSPHLRIEHRPMSASPTIADLFADTTLYIGLVHFLATMNVAPETRISFDQAKRNFYSAARKGLAAEVKWLTGATSPIAQLLRDGLQNQSFEATAQLGIDGEFLDACQQVISGRLENMQNGAAWQRRKFDQSAGNARDMLLEYAERQTQATPVHTWN